MQKIIYFITLYSVNASAQATIWDERSRNFYNPYFTGLMTLLLIGMTLLSFLEYLKTKKVLVLLQTITILIVTCTWKKILLYLQII